MTKKIYLETLNSVLGRFILHYCLFTTTYNQFTTINMKIKVVNTEMAGIKSSQEMTVYLCYWVFIKVF